MRRLSFLSFLLALALTLTSSLSACGVKGPLYLPGTKKTPQTQNKDDKNAPAAPATTPAEPLPPQPLPMQPQQPAL